jgi:hypothetical protein
MGSEIMRMNNYPDGTPIPESLPQAYKEGNLARNCGNCSFVMFLDNNYYCGKFSGNPEVRANWVCAAWKPAMQPKS